MTFELPRQIEVIDSHTEGEPTRVVVSGGPDLGSGSLAERRCLFRDSFDLLRRAVIEEPRGSDVLVGALLVPPRILRVSPVSSISTTPVFSICVGMARSVSWSRWLI